MFCMKCGNQIPDTAAFCNKCGQPTPNASAQAQASAGQYPQGQATMNQYPQGQPSAGGSTPPSKKKMSPLIPVIIAVVILLLGSAGFLGYKFLIQPDGKGNHSSKDFSDEKDDISASDSNGSDTKLGLSNSSDTSTSHALDSGADPRIGISMPTEDLQRWERDGHNMANELSANGYYDVDLEFANNDVTTQITQIKEMISDGADVLIIAPIEGSSLGEVLDMAKEANIPVISYDRLLMNSDAVSYYVTFDNYMVGTKQGEYVAAMLDLNNTNQTYTIEFTAGDHGDNNAAYFFNGAYDVLKPYIDAGKLRVVSGQSTFDQVTIPSWSTETSYQRAKGIISSYYSNGTNIDVWLCSNDSTALGVEQALEECYYGSYPIITGQDCDILNVKNIIAGKQSMSIFKDTRTLATQAVKMAIELLDEHSTVEVNDTVTYHNGAQVVPAYLCEPRYVDVYNYKNILIDSGYYMESDLQ